MLRKHHLDAMEPCRTNQYSDACTQTSPDVSATRLQDSMTVKTTPIPNRSKRVTYIDQTASGLYLDDSASRRIYPRTPISRMKTQLNLVPNDMLNSSPSVLVEPQRRVVSLPDQLGPELISQRIANSLVASSRNVSMPASVQRFRPAGLAFEEYPGTDSSTSISYDEESSVSQNFAHINDLLHTPSLPSTPNSIEIIDGSFHVPEAFLRNKSQSVGAMKTVPQDWLTWSNSPPRPIPALHGPSSLPYARCPSGAEGTIIEEPSSVPGLIWGLKNTNSSTLMEHTLAHEKPRIQSHDSPYQRHSLETLSPACHGHGRIAQEPLSVGTPPTLACDKHEKLPINRAGEHEVSYLEQGDAMMHQGTAQYEEAVPSVSTTAPDSTATIIQQNTLKSRRGYNQYGNPDDLLFHQQLCQIPDSLLHAILRERSRLRDDAAVLSGSSLSCPEMLYRSSEIDNMETATVMEMRRCHASASQDQSTIFLARNTTPQNIISTVPDSALPLWLSEPSPLLVGNNLITFEAPLSERPGISAPHLDCLNLQAPAESLESLSDQLRRLILHQQTIDYTTISYPCYRDPIQSPFHEQAASAVPNGATSNMIPVAPKPEMPINLHDLVARRIGGRPAIETSSSVLPNGGPRAHHVSEDAKGSLTPEMDTDTAASFSNERRKQYSNRQSTMTGKRHPRSVPLSRLLEKKLEPVPEETSFVDTTEEVQNGISLPVLTPTLISVKKDYDFTELRSPLEDAMAEESRCSEIGLADNAGRKVLQPARQRVQQVKQKVQNTSSGKATSSKACERRTKQNDENVHEPDLPMKTSTRKQKMTNKHARTGARGFGSQRTRH